jgi:phosphotriesterase-related protein
MTHTESATMGNEQLDILASEGVDFTRVIIGHSCGTADLGYHLSLLDRGVLLGFDLLGRPRSQTPERQQGLGQWDYTHLFKNVLPRLRTLGVSEAQIHTMLVENPQRFFG